MENVKPPTHLQWDSNMDYNKESAPRSVHEIERVVVNPIRDSQFSFEQMAEAAVPAKVIHNQCHYGDNYELLQVLCANNSRRIDLIYIDPPYMTELDYHSTIGVGTYSDVKHVSREAFKDRWPRGLDSYLDMLYPRISLMRQLLSKEGSIFVHVDWHVSHYVRVLLDEIFGRENFVNEIVWCFGGGGNSRKHFHRKHDLIFWYARSHEYIYNPQHRPYTSGTLQRGLTPVKGDRYKLHEEGALMQDWWVDVNKVLSPTARENLKFPTQKPKELIKRIIASASHPESLVADFFAGSGTTAEVCNELGRSWIMCDNSRVALQTTMYRLINSSSAPFSISVDQSYLEESTSCQLILKNPAVKKCDDNYYLIDIGIQSYRPQIINRDFCPKNFADYIEFWEVDLDFNGRVFNSHFQVIRDKRRFKEAIALDIRVPLTAIKNYQIAVRVYDIYANTTLATVLLGM